MYSLKRFFDPRWKSPVVANLEEFKILGLNELRQRSLKDKAAFQYDVEVEGLRALDRYTLQVRLTDTNPHFVETFADARIYLAPSRARSSRRTAIRSWRTRSVPGPSAWQIGVALLASFWNEILPIASRSSRPRLPTMAGR